MGRAAWRAAVHGVTKELDTTERLNNHDNVADANPGRKNFDLILWLLAVTVNCKCQLEWVMKCLHICLNIILSISKGVLVDQINI